MSAPICLTDLTVVQVQELVAKLGAPRFRADQLQRWIYQGLAFSFDEMVNLPASFRQTLARETRLHSLSMIHEVTGIDGTVKALFALVDGKTIEATLMPYLATKGKLRYTICLSTQVGCPIGCPFCATGRQGFERNLSPGEIIDQVLYFARRLKDNGNSSGITNLVFMGMGEPLFNYDSLWQSIKLLNSPQGFGLATRSMTVSTAGLVPQIKRFAREELQVGLAISLHASEDSLRDRLVPINRKYPIKELISACREYFEISGRRVSFEYILFAGLNDSVRHARSLAKLLSGLNCHVNLIFANEVSDRSFHMAPRETATIFQQELRSRRITCTIRKGRGLGIDAGCGQLRSRIAPPVKE